MRRSWSISSWLRAIRVPISLRAILQIVLGRVEVAPHTGYVSVELIDIVSASLGGKAVYSRNFPGRRSSCRYRDRGLAVLLAGLDQVRLRDVQLGPSTTFRSLWSC